MLVAEWQVISLGLVNLAVFVSALIYLAAKFFNSPQLEAASKSELIQAFASAVLIVFVLIAVPYFAKAECAMLADFYKHSMQNVGYLWLNSGGGNRIYLTPDMMSNLNSPPLAAVYFFDGLLNQYYVVGSEVYHWDMAFQELGQISEIDVFMNTPKGVGFISLYTSLTTSVLNQFYFYVLWFKFLIYVLLFFHAFALPILFPAGAALRAFPPTRGVGAYVIAFTLGAYFVFPFALLCLFFVVSTPFVSATMYTGAGVHAAIPTHEGTYALLGVKMGATESKSAVDYFMLQSAHLLSNVKETVKLFYNIVQVLLTQACLFPFAAIAFTMATIHGLNQLFGARIPEIGRGIIKFI